MLSASVENQLERRLVVFKDSTSTQIAIVTVNSLCDSDASFHFYYVVQYS
ncbi:MAG: TPM domain-containing protein [Flavobacteriales bacterium]|nr:TPM domain-containing protein [Flavobacteriales bacterium]